MTDRIHSVESMVLDRIEHDIAERGIDRIDIRDMGELVDMVKDLAEACEKHCKAEYYKTVVSAMGGKDRDDVLDALREAIRAAGKEEREELKRQIKLIAGLE